MLLHLLFFTCATAKQESKHQNAEKNLAKYFEKIIVTISQYH